MRVIAVARDETKLKSLSTALDCEYAACDATDEAATARLLSEFEPDLVVICMGKRPVLAPLRSQTWETFSVNWDADTKATFVWLRQALLLPMKPGSQIVVVSSGAAIHGSVLSGGYAGAKRTQWFLAKYAAVESDRDKLGLRIQCLLPMLSPSGIGPAAIASYADRAGISSEEFTKRLGPPLTPEILGQAVADMHFQPQQWPASAYQIAGSGLTPVL